MSGIERLAFAAAAAAACIAAAPAAAQQYPARPVRIIVPFAPGGGVDAVTRILAQKLTEQMGGSFVVENRPGSAGLSATEFVAKSAPDGHILLTSAPEFSINPSVRAKLPYDPFRDFAYISQLTSGQFMLASHPSVPARSVKDVIALAKARPGQLTYGSSGSGGINHLAGELLGSMTGIKWLHIPFKGAGPAMIGVMGGEIDFMFAATTGLYGPIKAGKVRGIAVTGDKRYSELPDVPTVSESGAPGYSVTGWYGFYAPAATPPDVLKRLNEEARRGLNAPDVKERLNKSGNDVVTSTPEAFLAFIKAEIAKWAKVVKAANIRAE